MQYSNEFLRKLADSNVRTLFARVVALTWDEYPINQIEGHCTGGSISIDGASAMRRSCSLTLVSDKLDLQEFQLMLNTKFKLEIGVQNDLDPTYPAICWFNQGIFLVSAFNTSIATNNYTINLSGKDKMAALNGEMGGVFSASTDLGQEEYYYWQFNKVENLTLDTYKSYFYYQAKDPSKEDLDFTDPDQFELCTISRARFRDPTDNADLNKITLYEKTREMKMDKVAIGQIITNLVHTFGGEPLRNIIINDLVDGLELLEYRGDKPTYLFKRADTYVIDHITTDSDYKVYINGKQYSVSDEDAIVYDLNSDINIEVKPTLVQLYNAKNGLVRNINYTIVKLEYGQTMGYKETSLVYAGDFIANVGETVVSALDKIKSMLVNFEYFYDVDGRFIFQQKRDYARGYSQILRDGVNEEYVDGTLNNSYISYSFDDLEKLVSFSHTPNLGNLKNDYSIWGNRKSVAQGSTLPVHLRTAIDFKPNYYVTLYPAKEGKKPINRRGGGILYINRDWSGANQNSVNKFNQALLDSLTINTQDESDSGKKPKDDSIQRAWQNLQDTIVSVTKKRRERTNRVEQIKSKIQQSLKDQVANVFNIPMTNSDGYNYRQPMINFNESGNGSSIIDKPYNYYHYWKTSATFYQEDSTKLSDLAESMGISTMELIDQLFPNGQNADIYAGFADFFFGSIPDYEYLSDWFPMFTDSVAKIKDGLVKEINSIFANSQYTYTAEIDDINILMEDIFNLINVYKKYMNLVFWVWRKYNGDNRLKALYNVLYAWSGGLSFDEMLDHGTYAIDEYSSGQSLVEWLEIQRRTEKDNIKNDVQIAISQAFYNSYIDYLLLNVNTFYKIKLNDDVYNQVGVMWNKGNQERHNIIQKWLKVLWGTYKWNPQQYNPSDEQKNNFYKWSDSIYVNKELIYHFYGFLPTTNATQGFGWISTFNTGVGRQTSCAVAKYYRDENPNPDKTNVNTFTITLPDGENIETAWTYSSLDSIPLACFGLKDLYFYVGECYSYLPHLDEALQDEEDGWQREISSAEQAYYEAIAKARELGSSFQLETEVPDFTLDSSLISKVRYVDWREIIYQMASDYYDFNQRDDYTQELRRLNPTMIEGVTKYEPYFTDLLGFWRQLYYHPAFESDTYELPDGYTVMDYGKYARREGSITDCCWNNNVFDNPERLNFWFDFIEADPWLSRFAVPYIGDRLKAANDSKVTSIYFRETPNILWFDNEIPDETQGGYAYASLRGLMQNCYTQSGQGKSAVDVLEEWLYQYAYCPEQVAISSVPVYHLQPNKCLYLSSQKMNISGKYQISKISMPFTYNGTMSITATKAVENLY